ncbi:hypothetical protein [Streptomyces sp. NPDC058451]|uniref:hypothetical protein n=1 Tax=Streptomyces sp. NPDC058451 TaxID=3346506 RepID=UPI00364C9A9D
MDSNCFIDWAQGTGSAREAPVEVTRRVGLIANDITAEKPKIKGLDAIHLGCAIFARAEIYVSRNFRDFAPGDVCNGVLLRTPFEFGGAGLFPASEVD